MAELLTTRQVQELLKVDRTTIYRMVEGRLLPAIRVGKQWRFDKAEIENRLRVQGGMSTPAGGLVPASPGSTQDAPEGGLADLLPLACSQMIQDAFADALGVMLVVTNMQGQPITQVSNMCGLYAAVMDDAESITRCVQNWQELAGSLPIEPRYSASALGLLCARGLIRAGNALTGMLFLGGIAPYSWPPPQARIDEMAEHFGVEPAKLAEHIEAVHRLDRPGRDHALQLVQRIADIFSHVLEDRHAFSSRLRAIASLSSL